ncbi:MAG: 4a-hydroxytetrahydrobiopterin dehydratase [Blastocatellia bacterium]|nr:4a-hydroxytetrahydrobiopterin dehydratase [Blastocatellia bacterium]
MERKKLEPHEVDERLAKLDGWTVADHRLMRRFAFENFAESLRFVNQVGEIAEGLDHHPDIKFGWGYAELSSTTHDRGGITDFDFELAARINRIAQNEKTAAN